MLIVVIFKSLDLEVYQQDLIKKTSQDDQLIKKLVLIFFLGQMWAKKIKIRIQFVFQLLSF